MSLFSVPKYLTSQRLKLLKYRRKVFEVRHAFWLRCWSESKDHNSKLKTQYIVKILHSER